MIFKFLMVEAILKDDKEGIFVPDTVRVIAALSYVAFFIPLMITPNNRFTKFHALQSFNLLLATITILVASWLVPIIGLYVILPAGGLFVVSLLILGLKNSFEGNLTQLPVIGKLDILKV